MKKGLSNIAQEKSVHEGWYWAIMVIGVFLITNRTYYFAEKHGGYDAYAIWNYHAEMLAHQYSWKKLFLYTHFGHPDYPYCLPAFLGFFFRLFHDHYTVLIPFAFSFLITLCTPLLIYTELFKKNIVIAALILILFATDDYFLKQGVSQYADTLLAFFFLCAIICMQHYKENKKLIVLCAAFLGCCMWTKNEGSILSVIFVLFHARTIFSKHNFKYFLAGIIVPLLIITFFKVAYAPANDLISNQAASPYLKLFQAGRYKMIYDKLVVNLNTLFPVVKIGLMVYIIFCIVERKLPNKEFVMLLVCMGAYFMIYVFTPYDVAWHLNTSQDRLMHHLMPAMMYVLGLQFSRVQFVLSKQQSL
ncbi:MAG TPA: hypothetical protein VN721_09670 [Flavipsychrobacter sp.]|nr:hypothetical protein [Flavipsychrobacter sp.]